MAGTEPPIPAKLLRRKSLLIFLYLFFVIFGTNLQATVQFNCDSLQCGKGDLNGDSILTPADVVLELNCIFSGIDSCDSCISDVNGDGNFSPADVVTQLNAVFLHVPIYNIDHPVIAAADTSNISDSLRQVYRDDAEQLALRMVVAAGGCMAKSAFIPNDLILSIYNTMIHLYNTTYIPARDSVVSMYCLHTCQRPANRYIPLKVDTSYAWVQAWRRGERFTGNPQIDSLMEYFDLYLVSFIYVLRSVYLKAQLPINPIVVAEKFRGIPGIVQARADYCVFDGDDITMEVGEDFYQLNFDDGYGDCPSGCTGHHIWSFKVYSDGRVEYLGSSGDGAWYPCCNCD